MPRAFADLADLPEDERIGLIGAAVLAEGKIVGVMVDDWKGKAARYIRKVEARFPTVQCLDQTPGPVAHVILLRFGPRDVA